MPARGCGDPLAPLTCATSLPSSCSTTSPSSQAPGSPTSKYLKAHPAPTSKGQQGEELTRFASPHRGQETITYLLQGGVDHEDFAGNAGSLNPGDLQFMTAGRGIMHAEMPRQNPDGSPNVGLQLWVDLPQHLKSCEPRYRDLRAAEIPEATSEDGKVTVKVISGQSHGVDSVKDLAYTPVWILDVRVRPGGSIAQPLPKGWNAFAYTLEGDAFFGQEDARRKVEQYHNVVFEQEGEVVHVDVEESATKEARFGTFTPPPPPRAITSRNNITPNLAFTNGHPRL